MKITIITPSFNQGQFLEETIDSVLGQGYPDLEYMVVDGGSTDESVDIIRKYEKHLAWWVSEPDRGQSHAINKGLARVTGEVFNWLNSDDYLEPGALATIAAAFGNPETRVFIGRSNIVADGKISRISRGTDVYAGNLAKTIGLARIDQPEHWWRKSALDTIGPLNEDLHYIMDRDWWVRYLLHFGLDGVVKGDTVLTNFRIHGESKTSSVPEKFNKERDAWFEKLVSQSLSTGSVHDKKVLQAAMPYFQLLLADEAYILGDFRQCRELLKGIAKEELDAESQNLYGMLSIYSRTPKPLIQLGRKLKR